MTTDTVEAATADLEAARLAADEARAAVAAAPDDEAAAEALFHAATRARQEVPPIPVDGPELAPPVIEAVRLLQRNVDEPAEILLRRHLRLVPNDPHAMRLMADIALRCGFPDNAEKILRRMVEVHPKLASGWVALAQYLTEKVGGSDQAQRINDALMCVDKALALRPVDEAALNLRTVLLVQSQQLAAAEKAAEQQLQLIPDSVVGWVNYGYLLKTSGRFGLAVAAYRTATALDPLNGAIWWSLADLKRARLFKLDIDRMEAALQQIDDDSARVDLHFALAAAYDQAKNYEKAARNLRNGNAIRLKMRPYASHAVSREIDRAIETYTPDFFISHRGAGNPSSAPIFILGMPRSGSTLVEQILSSHSQVEGTKELMALAQVVGTIVGKHKADAVETAIPELADTEFNMLGAAYLDLAQQDRHTHRPRFTDKTPDNWRHAGLIRLILPNAKIIDIRRHPLDCCFANYSQHFLAGADYSYGFDELAARYGEYVRLMRHLDEAAPGAVHRVIYEDLVEDLEQGVRRLLDYLELPFEEACLRFFETERAVHTPSAEQVRQPINRLGLGKWKPYEPWIGGLKHALGDLVSEWRH